MTEELKPIPMRVRVTREAFSDFYQLHLEDGQVEELEIVDLERWFDERGADMYAVGKALDYVFNFHQAEIVIRNPRRPKTQQTASHMPDLS